MKTNIIYIIVIGFTFSIIIFILNLFNIYNSMCFIVGFYTYKLIKLERRFIDDKTTKA